MSEQQENKNDLKANRSADQHQKSFKSKKPSFRPRAGNRDPRGLSAKQAGSSRRGFGYKKNSKGSANLRREESDLISRVVQVRRVTRVAKGGKRMRFRALVVVGDKQGKFGMGLKKGNDYADAVNKATSQAKKEMHQVKLTQEKSIPFAVTVKFKASKIFLKPARIGTGVIAGGPIRHILDVVGVKNILSKIIGSNNKVTNVMAVCKALSTMSIYNRSKIEQEKVAK